MHLSSKYGPDAYGTQHFRDENPKRWICNKVSQCNIKKKIMFL